jgi:23S rRNA pseudouridine1911/1915/1917 synthase
MVTGRPRSEVADLVKAGAVRVGGRVVTTRSARVAEGDVVEVDLPEVAVEAGLTGDDTVTFGVVHADEHVIVVDKPADLVVHPGAGNPTGTLVQGLLDRFPDIAGVGEADRPGIVHRLDRGTSGLLVVARTDAAYDSLVAQLSAHTTERRYLALAWGRFSAPQGLIDAPVGRGGRDRTRMAVSSQGREARTRYEVLREFDTLGADDDGSGGETRVETTLLGCRLETGRTHQIRVHLSAIGHPVVGDSRYGGARQSLPLDRPFLHAERLAFTHPGTGELVRFEAPLPADLAALLERLA